MPRKSRTRQGNGAGTVFKRKDGRWVGKLSYRGTDGQLHRLEVYGKTADEARTKLAEKKLDQSRGLLIPPDKATVEQWANIWLKTKSTEGRAANTLRNYQNELNYALPFIKHLPLQKVRPEHIRGVVLALTDQGKAPRTIKKVLERLTMLFDDAVKLEKLYRNPCRSVAYKAPPSEPVGRTLELWEIEKFLQVADAHPLGLFFRLILGCGLRRGEALALTWEDINFDLGELTITKAWTNYTNQGMMTTPKSRRSRRKVPIPPGLLERLKLWHTATVEHFPPNITQKLFLFGTPGENRPYHPNTPNHALERLRLKAGLNPFRVHDLRHTYGTLALSRGTPLEVVSERMGHANPTITLNVYRHVLEDERRGHVFDLEEFLQTQPRAQA